jgi:hypothetical protein
MTSAATFPKQFKSIELSKSQIKFKTINGFEGILVYTPTRMKLEV